MMKPKFKIGDCVVATYSTMEYEGYPKALKRIRKNGQVKGQIVGCVRRFEGSMEHGYFEGSKSYIMWQIREGYMNVPKEALEEDITLIEPFKIPFHRNGLSQNSRDKLSKEMKEMFKEHPDWFERDSKGRFK